MGVRHAMRRGDRAGARRARVLLHDLLAHLTQNDKYYVEGMIRSNVLATALQAGDLDEVADEVADELTSWRQVVNTHDLEGDNARRANARSLADGMLDYLTHPAATTHSKHDEIASLLEDLASEDHRAGSNVSLHPELSALSTEAPRVKEFGYATPGG